MADKSDVADLVQDVFLRLSRLNDLSLIDKPEQYLFATAASAPLAGRLFDLSGGYGSTYVVCISALGVASAVGLALALDQARSGVATSKLTAG